MRGEDEIRALLDSVLARVTDAGASASYRQRQVSATRFGENAILQNTSAVDETVEVTVRFGRRKGSASTTRIDEEALDEMVRNASDIARLSPEDPELMPLPGPQSYSRPPLTFPTGGHDADRIADGVARVIERAAAHDYIASGVFQSTSTSIALVNTEGLYGFDRTTDIDWSTTVHGPRGSGKATRNHIDPDKVDADALAREAVEGAIRAQNPAPIDPGDYDVVLAPLAVSQLLEFIGYMLSAREAAEGSTPFAGTLDTQHLSDAVTLRLAVDDPELPAPRWGADGLAVRERTWIERGVVKRLCHDRFWADAQATEPDPALFPFTMDGGQSSIDDLVRGCRRGLLVENLWYIRFVDPRTLTLTGLTRDGVFRIENGEITTPVQNLRWNESPIDVLRNLTGLSRAIRVRGMRWPSRVPAIASRDFTFTSTTDSL